MKIFGKKKSKPAPAVFSWLPEASVIHPAMPLAQDPFAAVMCERFNISIWDRDKLYNKLRSLEITPL